MIEIQTTKSQYWADISIDDYHSKVSKMLKSKEMKISEPTSMTTCHLLKGLPFLSGVPVATTGLIHLTKFMIFGSSHAVFALSVILLHGFLEPFRKIPDGRFDPDPGRHHGDAHGITDKFANGQLHGADKCVHRLDLLMPVVG